MSLILVTGAGGSIGSEIVSQLLLNEDDSEIICVDSNENSLFLLAENHKIFSKRIKYIPIDIASDHFLLLLQEFNFTQIIHAAAYKHVPLSQINPISYFINNIKSSINVLKLANANESKITLISSDKAVMPINVMGETKRMCELLFLHDQADKSIVRFGNVMHSNGSVMPIFNKQIAAGGPVTVTHREMKRFFMTISEAVELVLCATFNNIEKNRIFVLEMGAEISILDLAKNLIISAGKKPIYDELTSDENAIKIEFLGVRPGEKLCEELTYGEMMESKFPKIKVANEIDKPSKDLIEYLHAKLTKCEYPDTTKIDWKLGCLK